MTVEMVFSSKPDEVINKQLLILGIVQRETAANNRDISYYLVPNTDFLDVPLQIWSAYGIALSDKNKNALKLRESCYGKVVMAYGELIYSPASLSGIELTKIKFIDTGLPSAKRYCWPNKDITFK